MTMSSSNIKKAVEAWLKDSRIPVTSAAYRLSDKAALALSAGYLDPHLRSVLYTRLQKGSTTPRVGNVEELGKLAASASEWHSAAQEDPTSALQKSRFISDEGKLRANDLRSALAHRRYRKYMGDLGAKRRAFVSSSAFSKSWLGIRDEKRNGIFLNAQQRNDVFDGLCRGAAPTSIECYPSLGQAPDGYRLHTFSATDMPDWAYHTQSQEYGEDSVQLENQLEAPEHTRQDNGSLVSGLRSTIEGALSKVPGSIKGETNVVADLLNEAVSGVSRLIAGSAVGDDSWKSSREQLMQVQAADFVFVDSYDTALYILGIVLDRLDRSPAWNGDALATQASSIDMNAEVMEIATDICELREVTMALQKRSATHGVAPQRRLRDLGVVWRELVDRVVALVALADAVDVVDSELVRWSEHTTVDNLDERIDNLVARSGFRTTSIAHDHTVREDIAESGRVMATARSVIEQEIGVLGRGSQNLDILNG